MLVKMIYPLIESLPDEEKYNLSSQIRRSAVSISANLAEGSSRFKTNDKLRYITISYGSLMELYSHLQIAMELEYLPETELNKIKPNIYEVANIINGLRRSIQ